MKQLARIMGIAVVTIPLLIAPPVEGQQVRVGLHAGQLGDEMGNVGGGVTVQPEVRWWGSDWMAGIGAFGSVLDEGGALGGVFASGDGIVWKAGRLLQIGMAADGSTLTGAGGRTMTLARGSARLRAARGGTGAEIGPLLRFGGDMPAAGSAGGVFGLGDPSEARRFTSRYSTGARAGVFAGSGPVSIRLDWTTQQMAPGTSWSDWTGDATLDLSGISVGVGMGERTGAESQRWAAIAVAVPISAAAQISGRFGSYPFDPLIDRAAGRFAMAGLSLKLGSSRTRGAIPMIDVPLKREHTRVAIRAAPGSRVELLGEWNGWAPQMLREGERGVYAADLPLSPGVYRFVFRVDGRWTVPPGYQTEADDYGGKRALVFVGD